MGFSVSGAAAIVFTGMFIAFSMWYGAAYDSFERISDAQHDRSERALSTQNIDVEIVSAEYGGETLTLAVNNTGASTVDLNATDVLVDNEYRTDWRVDATAAGDGDTWLWQPGEQLDVSLSAASQPEDVRVVTDQGVADAAGVSTP